jgi:DNA-3-methyladenine glycosylase II
MYRKALQHFKTTDPVLFSVSLTVRPFEGTARHKVEDHFFALCGEIIGQQLSGRAADKIFERFVKLFPNKKVTPEFTLTIQEEKLREIGTSWAKARYIRDLAQKVLNREVHLEKIRKLMDEDVIAELTKVKGIGRWTAEMYLMFTLGRPDVFSFGDLGLQNAIKKVYKLKNKPTIKLMERLSKKWVPYRTYAARILWASLDNKVQ